MSRLQGCTYGHFTDQLLRLASVNLRSFQHLKPSDQVLPEASVLQLNFLLQAANFAQSQLLQFLTAMTAL